MFSDELPGNQAAYDPDSSVSGEPSQIQSQPPNIEEMVEKTENNLAQRTSSGISDDGLLDEPSILRDSVTSDDQDVLLELNTEEQEQFEVLDSADGEDDKSCESFLGVIFKG